MVSKRKGLHNEKAGPSKKIKRVLLSSEPGKKKKKLDQKKLQPLTKPIIEKERQFNEVAEDVKSDAAVETITQTETDSKSTTTNVLSDIPNWPMAHMSELIQRIENVLPARDHLVYKSRADRLNWDEIAFNQYSGTECRIMWDAIQKRVRRFRILQELIDDAKIWIARPWTNFYRGNKTNRHPDMPRRPLSTYMIFYMKKKDKVLKENPGLEMTGLSKHIAEMYKKLPPKTKEKYNELAVAQRKEYEAKLREFYRLHPELTPSNVKSSSVSQINDPSLKKPSTPFKMFCEDKLKRHENDENFDKVAFVERCKEQWRTMNDKKKVFWINWAVERESKYQEDMKKYVTENPDYVPGTTKSVLTKDERMLRERMAGKPEKPPNSAYSLFSRLMLASENIKTVSPKERMLLIAQQWKNCSENEKKEYADRVKHMLEQYKLQYAEYLESLPEDKRQEELLNNQPRKKTKIIKIGKNSESPTLTAKSKKVAKKELPSKKLKNNKTDPQKSVEPRRQLYEGEPEPPPATPFQLFMKNYEANFGKNKNAHEVWRNMSEEKKHFHRKVLWDMKKVYIQSYENFLKGLTQEELKEYSEWKKNYPDEVNYSSDTSSSTSDSECAGTYSDDEERLIQKKKKSNTDSSSDDSE